ncbi:MAG: hypothetical protein CM1200mP30_13440 [Pseudomonadota bacterium]|nr:MAG: hypothetical protein CM1200mP30_13440 [Pseudomonadota bacterium]
MFGVTTPAVQKVSALIEKHYDCLFFTPPEPEDVPWKNWQTVVY